MECPSCKNPLKDGAKFCGKCGTKIEQATKPEIVVQENVCINCGNPLKVGAKFCGKCGSQQKPQVAAATNNAATENEKSAKGFIIWEMQPGQIALRLTEKIFSQYSQANGVILPEGYLAVVMCGGRMQTMLEAGTYYFTKQQQPPTVVERITSFFANLIKGRKNTSAEANEKNINIVSQAVQQRIPVEIIVCRSVDFSLPFTFKNVATKTVSVDIGLLISLQVSNIVGLYKKHMLDKTVLAADTLANELIDELDEAVRQNVISLSHNEIKLNSNLKKNLSENFTATFAVRYPFYEFLGIIKMETDREELQRLERLSEEMYLSEQELEQLARRNEFINRLTQEQNSAELQNATNAVDFNRRLAEINRDNLLTEEEMAILQREIQERSEDHAFDRARAADLMVVQHQHDIQAAQVKMEEELGTRIFNLQYDRQRKVDEYKDERRKKEIDLDKEEQLGQLELLRQAQEIRQQRQQAEHDRKLEEKRLDQTHEKEKLNIYAGMTAEQIMVANPSITKEAANAMAEKFKAEATVAANDRRAQDAQEQSRMMKEFMEQQMQAVRDMASANANAMGGMLTAKEREIERTQNIIDKNEDRYAGVLKEQIRAGSKSSLKVCESCGQETEEETFCPECGSRLPKG